MGLDLSSLSDISALIRGQDTGNGIRKVKVDAIQPDPNQPRKRFDEVSLAELAQSIESIGMIQPPVVRTQDDGYLLISGERRWRAARQLGWEKVDVIVRDDLGARAQLVENIQREDLGAWDIYRVIAGELAAGTAQADLARALGKSRAWVAAFTAVDKMPDSLVTVLREGRITGITALGHLNRLLEDAPMAAAQLLSGSTQISRSMIEKAREGVPPHQSKQPTAVACSRESRDEDRRGGSQRSCTRIAAGAANAQRASSDGAPNLKSIARPVVRIRVRYGDTDWRIDYFQQRELDGVLSVKLEGDDGSTCFAPIETLRLQSIECI
ncbi:MAG: Chromosome (plasmid) partitioning protein ParB [Rhodanobacteraceae bacterium]|jgi:ParB family chromosome partitioning protein|nr:MAG: Chromosome (plasmid) partitioning protein ParB [Rhodanobacteraceae bacterium]